MNINTLDGLFKSFEGLDRFQAVRQLERVKALRPRFLYKFQGPKSKSVPGIIERSALWSSSRRDFNDPFDAGARLVFQGTPYNKYAFFLDLAKRQGMTDTRARDFAQASVANSALAVQQATYDSYVDEMGIVCFATSAQGARRHAVRNILMWSHYGVSHTGVCFQFHVPQAPATLVQSLGVEYDDDYLTINWVERLKVEKLISKALTRKSSEWIYEHERRIILKEHANKPLPFDPAGLAGIVFGASASKRTTLRVVAHCRRRLAAGLPAVRLFRSALKAGHYKLEVRRARDLEQLVTR